MEENKDIEKKSFMDILMAGTSMVHIDENGNQRRIEPYSKEYWDKILQEEKERVMKVGKFVTELNEWIEDDYCYSEAAAEIVDDYCSELQKEPSMTREVIDEDNSQHGEEPGIYYTDKACNLIEAEISHWIEVGEKYWPDGEIDIHQHLTQYREL